MSAVRTEARRSRYNFYLEDDLADYIAKLSLERWRGHKDFSKIIAEIIREHARHSTAKP